MKNFMLIGVGMCLSLTVHACDFCSVYLGLQPNDYRSSLRLSYRALVVGADWTTDGPKHLDTFSGRQREFYDQVTVTGQWFVTEQWRLTGQYSYRVHTQFLNRQLTQQGQGLGDLYLQAERMISVSRADRAETRWYHRVFTGVGVSVPTGQTDLLSGKETLDRDFQPGDGVWSMAPAAELTLARQNSGMQLRTQGSIALTETNGFLPGNALNTQLAIFTQIHLTDQITLTPMALASMENRAADRENDERLENTGGWQMLAGGGLTLRYRQLEWHGMYEHFVTQKLSGKQAPALRNWRVECRLYFNS